MPSEFAGPDAAIAAAIAQLTSTDLEVREAALAKTEEIAEGGLAAADVAALIQAASADLPPARYDWKTYDGALLTVIWRHAEDVHVPVIVQQIPKLSAMGYRAAVTALAYIQTTESTRAYVNVLREHGWP